MSRHSHLRSLTAAAIALLLLTSCAAAPKSVTHVTLTFASWVFISPEQQAFMDEVTTKSDKSITFTALDNWTEPDGVEKIYDEMTMAEAIAAGDIDVGWTTARSFPALGISGFRSLEAPFLIQNAAGLNDVATGPIGAAALEALGTAGLTGLSVYPGTLRYPLTSGAPLLQPSDWAGKDIEAYGTPGDDDSVQARTIRALGGTPVVKGLHIIDDLNAGLYAGGTDSLYDVAAGGAGTLGPFPTSNVIFWSTVAMYVINTKKFESLDPSQRDIIAAAAAHAAELDVSPDADLTIGTEVCKTGARFGTASADQLSELRAAVQPVYDWLATDPAEQAMLEKLQDIAAAHPVPDAVVVPDGCAWKVG